MQPLSIIKERIPCISEAAYGHHGDEHDARLHLELPLAETPCVLMHCLSELQESSATSGAVPACCGLPVVHPGYVGVHSAVWQVHQVRLQLLVAAGPPESPWRKVQIDGWRLA
jgi:hypothetical protein